MSVTYEYRARDAQGTERKGRLGGATSAAVARELATMGLVPLEIRARQASGADAAKPSAPGKAVSAPAGRSHCAGPPGRGHPPPSGRWPPPSPRP